MGMGAVGSVLRLLQEEYDDVNAKSVMLDRANHELEAELKSQSMVPVVRIGPTSDQVTWFVVERKVIYCLLKEK